MRDYEEAFFTQEEVKIIAGKWFFWKGLFIGAIGMLVALLALGLFINY